jgi:iron(II)-dependent oxidoreductase
MVRVPPGAFMMGTEAGSPDERPAHTIHLPAFEIDVLPVVNAQFAAFLNETGSTDGANSLLYDLTDPSARIGRSGDRFMAAGGFEQHPMVAETWHGARAFCAWRGTRLPTEAAWERAARGADGRTYPWGEEPPDATRARYAYRTAEYLKAGSYLAGATPDGILDMAGNVWQWTSSLYRPYPYRADDSREDQSIGGERVIRGGDQSSSAEMLRSTYRTGGATRAPRGARPHVTFRCARDTD